MARSIVPALAKWLKLQTGFTDTAIGIQRIPQSEGLNTTTGERKWIVINGSDRDHSETFAGVNVDGQIVQTVTIMTGATEFVTALDMLESIDTLLLNFTGTMDTRTVEAVIDEGTTEDITETAEFETDTPIHRCIRRVKMFHKPA